MATIQQTDLDRLKARCAFPWIPWGEEETRRVLAVLPALLAALETARALADALHERVCGEWDDHGGGLVDAGYVLAADRRRCRIDWDRAEDALASI